MKMRRWLVESNDKTKYPRTQRSSHKRKNKLRWKKVSRRFSSYRIARQLTAAGRRVEEKDVLYRIRTGCPGFLLYDTLRMNSDRQMGTKTRVRRYIRFGLEHSDRLLEIDREIRRFETFEWIAENVKNRKRYQKATLGGHEKPSVTKSRVE